MTSLVRKVQWWLRRRRREEELGEELQFHVSEEIEERRADGMPPDKATWAARRDLGNTTLVREDARALWSWVLLEQLAQDLRYGLRGMFKDRLFTALAALSLALGIGANTAIYSFMDSILLRSLPVADPASLIVVKWRSTPINRERGGQFVMRSIDGHAYPDTSGVTAAIFPFPAFERLHDVSASVLSSLFAHKEAGSVNVIVSGQAELVPGEYVSGDFFRGLAVVPAAGRLIDREDDRAGAAAVAVLSNGYCQRRFGDVANAVGQGILINSVPFTVIGITPPEFFGVDPASAPQVYLPMRTSLLFQPGSGQAFTDPNYYFGDADADPVGRRIEIGDGMTRGVPRVLEIVGVAANARYGGLKGENPPVVYISYAQVPAPRLGQVTYALRTESDPLRYAATVRQIVHKADGRVPVTNLKTQAADIDQTINQEIVFTRLCSVFAILALTIACVGLYATMAYAVARRTGEIGLRLALGAGRGAVVWMMLRDVCVLAAVGLAIGASAALAMSRLIESFLFETKPNVPRAVALAAVILLISALAAGYGPAWRASRVDPLTALRHE